MVGVYVKQKFCRIGRDLREEQMFPDVDPSALHSGKVARWHFSPLTNVVSRSYETIVAKVIDLRRRKTKLR